MSNKMSAKEIVDLEEIFSRDARIQKAILEMEMVISGETSFSQETFDLVFDTLDDVEERHLETQMSYLELFEKFIKFNIN